MTFGISFLHTAEVHVGTFGTLVKELSPGTKVAHVVDESLLTDARERGVDAELRVRLLLRLEQAASMGDVVVCTCSTLSGYAEEIASDIAVPVVRIDRPLAERAVSLGSRIAVVVAVESTIVPTTELLRSVGEDVDLHIVHCYDAWPKFEAGDIAGYHRAIARRIDALQIPVDVFVLAQASMAGVESRCHADAPILSSPRLAVVAALAFR